MSERGYFSQRYLIPGSTFLLLILVYNFAFLSRMLNQQTSVLLGAAVALLGSPTLGFLVSQIWWWHFQRNNGTWSWTPVQTLIEKYGLNSLTKRQTLMVYDYVLFSELHTSKPGLSSYTFRRYDSFVLLSTTNLSLALGAVVGVSSRIFSEYFIFGIQFWKDFSVASLLAFLQGKEFWVLATISVVTLILITLIRKGQQWIKFEYDEMHKAIILTSDIKLEALTKVFPDYFKKKGNRHVDIKAS